MNKAPNYVSFGPISLSRWPLGYAVSVGASGGGTLVLLTTLFEGWSEVDWVRTATLAATIAVGFVLGWQQLWADAFEAFTSDWPEDGETLEIMGIREVSMDDDV